MGQFTVQAGLLLDLYDQRVSCTTQRLNCTTHASLRGRVFRADVEPRAWTAAEPLRARPEVRDHRHRVVDIDDTIAVDILRAVVAWAAEAGEDLEQIS